MDLEKIKNIQRIASEIGNFRDCYTDCNVPVVNGQVQMESILAWLIENPHMAKIAIDIKKLDNETKNKMKLKNKMPTEGQFIAIWHFKGEVWSRVYKWKADDLFIYDGSDEVDSFVNVSEPPFPETAKFIIK